MMNLWGKAKAGLSATYDAVTRSTSRRRQFRIDNRSEDKLLRPQDRDKLISDARALRRNAAEAQWMIRRHKDYVCAFSFRSKSGDKELDKQLTKLVKKWSKPEGFDAAGKLGLDESIRIIEGLAITDGDCFVLKLEDGTVQLIEADRVRTPSDLKGYGGNLKVEDFTHGVNVDATGRALNYAVCDRDGNGNSYMLNAVLPAGYVFHHAYRENRADQVRGVSQLASALNTFFDLYEAREYALAKMKLSQLFALKMTRTGNNDSADAVNPQPYEFKFGSGPQVLDLEPGDNAEFLESGTPSNEFQSFWQTGLQVALKALDIPYSFYSEDFTNYSGARIAFVQYEQAADSKRKRLQRLLDNLTSWRLSLFIQDGELELPNGLTVADLEWEWVPSGITPYIDPLKEAQADQVLIDSGMACRRQLAKWKGEDWDEIIESLADEQNKMKELGLTVKTGTPVIEETDKGEPNDRKSKF